MVGQVSARWPLIGKQTIILDNMPYSSWGIAEAVSSLINNVICIFYLYLDSTGSVLQYHMLKPMYIDKDMNADKLTSYR